VVFGLSFPSPHLVFQSKTYVFFPPPLFLSVPAGGSRNPPRPPSPLTPLSPFPPHCPIGHKLLFPPFFFLCAVFIAVYHCFVLCLSPVLFPFSFLSQSQVRTPPPFFPRIVVYSVIQLFFSPSNAVVGARHKSSSFFSFCFFFEPTVALFSFFPSPFLIWSQSYSPPPYQARMVPVHKGSQWTISYPFLLAPPLLAGSFPPPLFFEAGVVGTHPRHNLTKHSDVNLSPLFFFFCGLLGLFFFPPHHLFPPPPHSDQKKGRGVSFPDWLASFFSPHISNTKFSPFLVGRPPPFEDRYNF